MQPHEIIKTDKKTVACDGKSEGQNSNPGHPLVYLKMGADNQVDCPYCGRRFVLKAA